jgi:hypothetical protein
MVASAVARPFLWPRAPPVSISWLAAVILWVKVMKWPLAAVLRHSLLAPSIRFSLLEADRTPSDRKIL